MQGLGEPRKMLSIFSKSQTVALTGAFGGLLLGLAAIDLRQLFEGFCLVE